MEASVPEIIDMSGICEKIKEHEFLKTHVRQYEKKYFRLRYISAQTAYMVLEFRNQNSQTKMQTQQKKKKTFAVTSNLLEFMKQMETSSICYNR
jgi:hypothetical protein